MNYHISTISIITACYNSEKYLDDTISSILKQTYTNWELIIVDDNSTDSSTEIIKKYSDPRIKLIELNENLGAAEARNIGIEKAIGRFIAFIDSDDIWLPNALEERIFFLLKNDIPAVYSSYKRVDENLKPILEDFIAEDHVTFSRLLKNCPVFIGTLMYDSKKIGKLNFPTVYRREDYAMILNLSKIVKEIRAIKKVLVIYRIRNNSYSRNKFLMFKLQFLVYYNFLNLSLIKSLYYTSLWALNGLKKYGRI